MKKEEFISILQNLKTAKSVSQGKLYTNISVNAGFVHYTRESGSKEDIDINELFNLYNHNQYINTNIAREYISGRKFSPAVAILISSGIYNSSGYRNEVEIKNDKIEEITEIKVVRNNKKLSDEERFFIALEQLIGDCIISKTLNRTVNANEVFLNDDYRKMGLPPKTEEEIKNVLKKLQSNLNFKGGSLTQHIDGLITNHPVLGSRIVEFDEEQHFSPARLITLSALQNNSVKFAEYYFSVLNSLTVFNSMLTKNRLSKIKFDKLPDFDELLKSISKPEIKESGYIEPKNGFEYKGGRLAQRAYYDLLRDVAHLSETNNSLLPILRFPKVSFENQYSCVFSKISQENIKLHIIKLLKEIYQIELA